jgi:aminopeptidase N
VQRYLYALAGFRDAKLLDRTIQSVLSEHVRTQDAPYLFQTILMNEDAADAAWKFMQERWDDMIAAYPENGVVRMIGGVTALDTPAMQKEVEAFFASHPVKQGDMAVAQALEQLSINVRLREGESGRLSAHLVPATKEAAATK